MSDFTPEPHRDSPLATWSAAVGRAARVAWSRARSRDPVAVRTRWALAAAALGATIAAVMTAIVAGNNPGEGLHTQVPGGSPVADAAAGTAFGSARPGDCLTWTKPDASDLGKTGCAQSHLFEVAANIDLNSYPGAEFASGAPFPSDRRFAELNTEHCLPAARQYMDGKLDPHGKFKVGMINPGAIGWSRGERTLRCGLQESGPGGARLPMVGAAAGQDQSNILPPGSCYGINDRKLPTDPVDCSQPHAWEVISVTDLGTHFTGGPPSEYAQHSYLSNVCQKDSGAYLGSPNALRNKTLTIFHLYIAPDSWLEGSRKLNCMIGQAGDNGFATIVGSAKGAITINGRTPQPPPLPNRR